MAINNECVCKDLLEKFALLKEKGPVYVQGRGIQDSNFTYSPKQRISALDCKVVSLSNNIFGNEGIEITGEYIGYPSAFKTLLVPDAAGGGPNNHFVHSACLKDFNMIGYGKTWGAAFKIMEHFKNLFR